jgi:hypothetical protein
MSTTGHATMFVYALTEPIDDFDALTPLPEWITADPPRRTRWALQAVLALADTAAQVRWNGDMRHQPSVGATLDPPGTCPYLVVKQDNNGTTFVVSAAPLPWLTEHTDHTTQTRPRDIGAWTHPTRRGHQLRTRLGNQPRHRPAPVRPGRSTVLI